MKNLIIAVCALICFWPSAVVAEDRPDGVEELKKLLQSLKYQQGEIDIRNGLAGLKIPPEFRYLGPEDAQTVLVKIWGNPPDEPPLGMIVPANVSVASAEGWAVIITYAEDGFVKDDDASKIDYGDMLKQMQASTTEANAEREKQGYAPIELVGWAAPPRYDASTHKFYWAKELKFGKEADNTLNYNIRILGRRGVLVLNTVAAMAQVQDIEKATPEILAMVEFKEGHRYSDFDASADKVATYGLAALVAGGVAAKAGFFKMLIAFILAAKKLIIAALIGLGVWLRKYLKGQPSSAPAPVLATAPAADAYEYECDKCGAGVAAGAKVCPKCGADVSKVE